MGKRNLVLRPSAEIRMRAINTDTGARLIGNPRPDVVETILSLTRAYGPERAGRWVWERDPTELWDLSAR